MNYKVQNLLKKINFIEADIEIQKQILHATPSEDQKELEQIIKGIAGKKGEINVLRDEIKQIAPEEYAKIIRYEKASDAFRKLATEKNFVTIESMNTEKECILALENNKKIHCLVKAQEENGNFTIMTLDGEIEHYPSDSVFDASKETSQSTPH